MIGLIIMRKFILAILLVAVPLIAHAQTAKTHKYYEKDYQNVWCKANGGITEVVLPDKARVDCVTKSYAIEFDFAKKWAESIGQALYYGKVLNKTPGIVLIIENKEKDQKYIKRVKSIADNYGIKLWEMTPQEML